MKKIIVLMVVMLSVASVVTIQSCQSAKSSTASKMLKFNFENGKGYDYEMITNMDQEIMGQSMQMDMTAYYSMDVKEDDGMVKTIVSVIDRFKMKVGVGGMNIDIDTDKPLPNLRETEDGKDPMKMMNSLLGAIKGQKFTMKVDAEGKIMDVTGFENMAKTIVDSMGVDTEKRQEMIDLFGKQFNADKMKSQLERVWYIFPNKEVKVGDSWDKTSQIKGEMGGTYNSNYKVTDIEGDMVSLTENTKMESSEDKMKLKGDITGTLVVDSRQGLIVNADQDMKIVASGEGMSFEIKGKTKIKGKARN